MDREHTEENAKKEDSSFDANIGYIFQSIGVRCSFRTCNELDRIISNNRYYILFHLNPIFLYLLDYVKTKL